MIKRTYLLVLVIAASLGMAFTWILRVQPSTVTAEALETPSVARVDPHSSTNDLDTAITITGTGFTAGISGTAVITQPTVLLGSHELVDVGWVNGSMITATVPWGLSPGVYPLTVVNPDGGSGTLQDALTVTQGIGVWTTGGPYGGASFDVIINPSTPTTLYATAAIGTGLFRSRDSGENWQMIFGDLGYGASIAQDPFLPATLYMGTGKWGTGLYRSDDEGDTWLAIPIPGLELGVIRTLKSSHTRRPRLCMWLSANPVSIPMGLYWSTDRGASWDPWMGNLTDPGKVSALAFHPLDPQTCSLARPRAMSFNHQWSA
jgi:hypothetical protein